MCVYIILPKLRTFSKRYIDCYAWSAASAINDEKKGIFGGGSLCEHSVNGLVNAKMC